MLTNVMLTIVNKCNLILKCYQNHCAVWIINSVFIKSSLLLRLIAGEQKPLLGVLIFIFELTSYNQKRNISKYSL